MSTHTHTHTHSHHVPERARLRELSRDPTHTRGLRERFLRDVRQRFQAVRGALRRVAGYERDRFNLRENASLATDEDIERFATDAGKTRAFTDWLQGRLRDGILEPVSRRALRDGEHWTATYIRAAYVSGWEQARERLENAGITTSDVEDVFQLGVPRAQLKRLYTRTYENLQSVTADAAPQVRDTLTKGLAEGVNPRELARRLTKEVRTLQRTRAEVLARTEVINSYSEATLDRYERAGQSGVTVSGEFATADDDRVCPLCESIEGTEYAVSEMRTATFEYDTDEREPDSLGGTYPVKPPVHPQCRCAILPVIE
jgi:SPP1 gp7 family putative phage head morphogenesis protein